MSNANKASFDAIRDFIFLSEEPCSADLILIPGAPIKELAVHGAELYSKGYAKRILATGKYYLNYSTLDEEFEVFTGDGKNSLGQETEAEFLKVLLMENGVPEDAIILEKDSRSTFENAINSGKLIKRMFPDGEIKHVLLCCQAFHARRALMTFQSELRDIKITVCPVVTRGISRDNYMDRLESYNLVLGELRKCGDYFKGSRMYDQTK